MHASFLPRALVPDRTNRPSVICRINDDVASHIGQAASEPPSLAIRGSEKQENGTMQQQVLRKRSLSVGSTIDAPSNKIAAMCSQRQAILGLATVSTAGNTDEVYSAVLPRNSVLMWAEKATTVLPDSQVSNVDRRINQVIQDLGTLGSWNNEAGDMAPQLMVRLPGWPAHRTLAICNKNGGETMRYCPPYAQDQAHDPVTIQLDCQHYASVLAPGLIGDVPRDGDCFYHAVIGSLSDTEATALLGEHNKALIYVAVQKLREGLVHYVQTHRNEVAQLLRALDNPILGDTQISPSSDMDARMRTSPLRLAQHSASSDSDIDIEGSPTPMSASVIRRDVQAGAHALNALMPDVSPRYTAITREHLFAYGWWARTHKLSGKNGRAQYPIENLKKFASDHNIDATEFLKYITLAGNYTLRGSQLVSCGFNENYCYAPITPDLLQRWYTYKPILRTRGAKVLERFACDNNVLMDQLTLFCALKGRERILTAAGHRLLDLNASFGGGQGGTPASLLSAQVNALMHTYRYDLAALELLPPVVLSGDYTQSIDICDPLQRSSIALLEEVGVDVCDLSDIPLESVAQWGSTNLGLSHDVGLRSANVGLQDGRAVVSINDDSPILQDACHPMRSLTRTAEGLSKPGVAHVLDQLKDKVDWRGIDDLFNALSLEQTVVVQAQLLADMLEWVQTEGDHVARFNQMTSLLLPKNNVRDVRGLFAKRDIQAFEVLGPYPLRLSRDNKSAAVLQNAQKKWVDAGLTGNRLSQMGDTSVEKDACNYRRQWPQSNVGAVRLGKQLIFIVARENIKSGQALYFDRSSIFTHSDSDASRVLQEGIEAANNNDIARQRRCLPGHRLGHTPTLSPSFLQSLTSKRAEDIRVEASQFAKRTSSFDVVSNHSLDTLTVLSTSPDQTITDGVDPFNLGHANKNNS
ncbi:MAG: hypothetical protein IT497_04065 [Ottowia sp.]|nr:hypothetical protein [Ottowia sp.]